MKLIIWDLDETLWFGTIYHGDKVKLKPETKEVLKQINKLGIIQCVCSHNKLEPVKKQLEEFGLTKYFKDVVARIDEEKPELIKPLLEKHNIAPEETLFVDDTALNRAMVREFIGCNVDFDMDLYQIMKYIDTPRLVLMNQQRNRVTAEKKWTGNKAEFLEKIGNKMYVKPAEMKEIPRITNLANRTNELNAGRNRYNEKQITQFIKSNQYQIWVAYLSDNFGDYGLIGEVIIKEYENDKTWFIKDLCVSCRTMGRGVGRQLLNFVVSHAETSGANKIIGFVLPNDDNFRMGPLFERCGFKKFKEEDGAHFYERLIEE